MPNAEVPQPAAALQRSLSASGRLQTQVAPSSPVKSLPNKAPVLRVLLSCRMFLTCRATLRDLSCSLSFWAHRNTLQSPQMVSRSFHSSCCPTGMIDVGHLAYAHLVLVQIADMEMQVVAALALQHSPGASSLSTPQ